MRGTSLRVAAAAAFLAMAIPAASAAPGPSLGVIRAKLADAIADEERAKQLLERKPPRTETARLVLNRSREVLNGLLQGPLPHEVRYRIDLAARQDSHIDRELAKGDHGSAAWRIGLALQHKAFAMAELRKPATAAQRPQCSDGLDNDGDKIVDASHDSGCANAKDASEGSALAVAALAVIQDGSGVRLQGRTSGPVAEVEIVPPRGVEFDTAQTPKARFSTACRISRRLLECLMRDGTANPRHVVNVGPFRLKEPLRPASTMRIFLKDFAGRSTARSVAPQGTQPPTGPPKDVTQSFAVPADGTIARTVTTSGTLRVRFENLSREFDSSRCATLLIVVSVDGKTGEEIGVIPGDTIVFRDPGRVSAGRHTVSITSRVYRGACEPIPHPGGRLDVITSTG